MSWSIHKEAANVAHLRVPFRRSEDWRFYMLASADRHIDHALSDLDLQYRHLREAKKNNWPVIDVGDLFCAMQGKRDPRSSRRALLDLLNQREEYMDALVDYAHECLSPYAKQLALMGLGNHELGALKANESHLLNRLVGRLANDGSPAVLGGYQGWVKLMFQAEGKSKESQSFNLRYTHGAGGGAPVTKGVIQTNRRAVVCPDAHIFLAGHTHEQWMVPLARLRLNDRGAEYQDLQLHLQIPSYKDEVTGQTDGFAVEKQHLPKPKGAWWIRFWFDPREKKIKYDAMLAQ
jgi:hypothetical protein